MRFTPLAGFLAVLLTTAAGAQPGPDRDERFQVSTLDALAAGVFDGKLAVGDLLTRGDKDLGTFHALDGEMVVVRGLVYRMSVDGTARCVPPTERTPFAAVTSLEADPSAAVPPGTDLPALMHQLDALLPSPNLFCPTVVEGQFTRVRTRSVPAQTRPYPTLAQVAAHQPLFEPGETRGTLIGLRCPRFVAGINLPDYQLHFLDESRTRGGHVLECVTAHATATLDSTPRLRLVLPESGGFLTSNLTPDPATVGRVEGRK